MLLAEFFLSDDFVKSVEIMTITCPSAFIHTLQRLHVMLNKD